MERECVGSIKPMGPRPEPRIPLTLPSVPEEAVGPKDRPDVLQHLHVVIPTEERLALEEQACRVRGSVQTMAGGIEIQEREVGFQARDWVKVDWLSQGGRGLMHLTCLDTPHALQFNEVVPNSGLPVPPSFRWQAKISRTRATHSTLALSSSTPKPVPASMHPTPQRSMA